MNITDADRLYTRNSIFRAQVNCFGTGHLRILTADRMLVRDFSESCLRDRMLAVVVSPQVGAPRIEGAAGGLVIVVNGDREGVTDPAALARLWWERAGAAVAKAEAREANPETKLVWLLSQIDWLAYMSDDGSVARRANAAIRTAADHARTMDPELVRRVWRASSQHAHSCPV